MRGGEAARFSGAEPAFAEHAVNFGEGVRVAGRRGAKHSHGEESSIGRGNPVFVRHELDHSDETAGFQRHSDSLEQRYVGREIEVVKEVRQECYIVPGTQSHFEQGLFNRSGFRPELRAVGA